MDKRIICVAGPTASGKTGLAIALARALGGEVVSCDSMQIYRGMDIGTAKPTREEMQGVTHHLLDVADPREDFSVSRYVALADAAVQEILGRGRTAIICGGTGLYMDSLIAGRSFAPCPTTGKREQLEQLAEEQGIEAVLALLEQCDPESARRLPPGDRKRIIRAMEVYLETGHTITWHNRQTRLQPPKYDPLWLGLDFAQRQTLYDRIDRRAEQMIDQGLEAEVRRLVDSGVPESATAMQAIGYKEMLGVLHAERSIEQALADIQQGSRRYAKRQLTWFRRNQNIHWLIRRETEEIFPQALQIFYNLTESDK